MMISAESSRTTHPGRIAAAACRFLGFLIGRALTSAPGQTAQDFLDQSVSEYMATYARPEDVELQKMLLSSEPVGSKERCWNWKAPSLEIEASLATRSHDGMYNGYPVNRDYFGSYCMDGLAVALHCVYNTSNFSEAIVRCVNFLGDADSTSAICGQIAGAFYGLEAIVSRFVERLERWDDKEVACKAVLLWVLGAEADDIEEPPTVIPVEVHITPQVAQIMGMGFSAAEADGALSRADGDVQRAVTSLLSR